MVRNVNEKRLTAVRAPRRSSYSWSKTVSPLRRSCRTDSVSLIFPTPRRPARLTRRSYSAQRGRSGHEIDGEQPAARQDAVNGRERRAEIALPRQRLQHAVGRHHQREARTGGGTADGGCRRAAAAPRPASGAAAGARASASAPSDRCRRSALRRAPRESSAGRCRTRARAPGRPARRPAAARTRRRAAPGFAHFPSRRTGRSRPSPASLQPFTWRPPSAWLRRARRARWSVDRRRRRGGCSAARRSRRWRPPFPARSARAPRDSVCRPRERPRR